MNKIEKNWLVFYTKARSEKAVEKNLRKFGFEPYLPIQKVLRQWSDRKKKVELNIVEICITGLLPAE